MGSCASTTTVKLTLRTLPEQVRVFAITVPQIVMSRQPVLTRVAVRIWHLLFLDLQY